MNKRETELDLLRILACIAVVIVHCCAFVANNMETSDLGYSQLTFMGAIMTWQVPVFVMISGRFFLDPSKNVNTKKIWGHYIPRLVCAFCVWNIIYQIYYIMTGMYNGLNWKGILIEKAIIGPYHFWYLWMLVCLYIAVPILRKITENKKTMEYYIVLFITFEFISSYGIMLPYIGSTIKEVLNYMSFHIALGYSGYFILGYYLYKYPIDKKYEILLYLIGIVLVLGTGGLTVHSALYSGKNEGVFTRYLNTNIIVEAIAIYTFFVKRVSKIKYKNNIIKIISIISQHTFGVYLIHAIMLEILGILGIIKYIAVNPAVAIIVSLLCFILSFLVCYILKKIPVVRKIVQ